MNVTQRTQWLKNTAARLGFSFCGIAQANFLEEDASALENWLKSGFHGKMQYMENHFDKRLDPRLLVPGTKSVVSLMYNYFHPQKQSGESVPLVSMYAYGEDYHRVIKDKLFELVAEMRDVIGEVGGRVFTDSAPVLERAWARKAGLGWIGKNAQLINKSQGSYFFLAELLLDIDFEYDTPIGNYCGTCTACIDACPTQAILPGKKIDAQRCISYLTIELRDELNQEQVQWIGNHVFGCDICQEVCPWNRFSQPHHEPRFEPNEAWFTMNKQDWIDLDETFYTTYFSNSAISRTAYNRFRKNIDFILHEKP